MTAIAERAREAIMLSKALARRGFLVDPLELAATCAWQDVDGERLVFTTHHLHRSRILLATPVRLTPRSLTAGIIGAATREDLRRLADAGARITAVQPFSEYLYSARRTAELRGPELENVRKKIRRFTTAYPFRVLERLPLERLRPLLAGWLARKQRAADEQQRAALRLDVREELESLNFLPYLPHRAVAVEADGLLAGYIIGVPIDDRHWSVPYMHASTTFKGLAEFLYWRLAKEFPPETTYTAGGDVMDGGLASFKRKFRPVEVREEYCVTFEPPA